MSKTFSDEMKTIQKEMDEMKKLKLDAKEQQDKVSQAIELLTLIVESLTVLDKNFKQLEADKQPQILYKQYVGNVIAAQDIAPLSAVYLLTKFPNQNIPPNQKIAQYIPLYKDAVQIIKQKQKDEVDEHPIKSLLKQITFLDSLLGRKNNIRDPNIIPPDAAAAFTRLLIQNISPQSAPSDMYGRSIYVGQAIHKKYGKWVPNIGEDMKKEVHLEKRDDTITMHCIIGRLFVQSCKIQGVFTNQITEGLRLSRLVLAVSPDGELNLPIQKSYGEFQTSFKAMVEYTRNYSKLLNEKEPTVEFQINNDDVQQLKNLFQSLKQYPILLDNQKVNEILDDVNVKVQALFDDYVHQRQALNVIQSKFAEDGGTSYNLTITPAARTDKEIVQHRKELDALAFETAAIECIMQYKQKQFELTHEQDVKVDKELKRQQFLAELDNQLNETESYYKSKLISDKPLPKYFQVTQVNPILAPNRNAKIQILLNNKIVQQAEIALQSAISVRSVGSSIQLGADLSTDLPAPLSSFTTHQKVLPKLQICVQIGPHSQIFQPPAPLGESSSAYDVQTPGIEFTLGYYLNIKGAGYNPNAPQKQLQYQYDPNMNFQIKSVQAKKTVTEQVEQDKKVAKRTSRTYKGGNFMGYKQVLQGYFDLEKSGANQYDKDDYVNLLDKTLGKQMHIIDAKRTLKFEQAGTVKMRYSFEDVWKGPNDEPLFLPQYLSAMKALYENLIKLQGQTPQMLEILWDKTPWENPFIPRPIFWSPRPMYPTRVLQRAQGRELYELYLREFGEDSGAEEKSDENEGEKPVIIQGLTQKKSIKISVQLDSVFPITDKRGNIKYFATVTMNGGGEPDPEPTNRAESDGGIAIFNKQYTLNAPLPEVTDESTKKVIGYDESDESLAQLPYSIKIHLYQFNESDTSYLNIGQTTIPLKTVFLNGEVKGDLMLSDTLMIRMMCNFSPPRMPISSKPELYFANCSCNNYSRQLPNNIATVLNQIQMLPTRQTLPCAVEIDFLSELSQKQKTSYLLRYATRTPYFKRGIGLFVQTPSNEMLFVNDFIILPSTANTICSFLKIESVADAVKLSVAVPFVPDTVSRYYITSKFLQFQNETRLNFEQVLTLSGGDYFEHACLLQACIQSVGKGVQAFVARVCTQTLTNEYFVLCKKADEITIIDPVTGRGYIIWKDFGANSKEVLEPQTYVTRVIQLFDAKEIYINLQPDLHPCFTDFDTNNAQLWTKLEHASSHADVDFKRFFYSDQQVEVNDIRLNQLEELRKEEIVGLVKEYIKDQRGSGQVTTFNESIVEALEKGNEKPLERFSYYKYVLECAYEDSAILLEKIQKSTVWMTEDPLVNFAVVCKLKAFGLKFGHLKLDIYALVKKSSGEGRQQIIKGRGTKFGTGW